MEQLNEKYFPDDEKITRYGFISHMEKYMKELLTNPLSARPDSYLEKYGIDYKKAHQLLLDPLDSSDPDSAVMRKEEKITTGPDGKDKFIIKYRLPRKDYNKKMRKLFIQNFESNIIEGLDLNEEGEGGAVMGDIGGATNASQSGQFVQPLFGKKNKTDVINKPVYTPKGVMEGKRKAKTVYISEKHVQKLKEATAGDIGQGYDVPFGNGNSDFYGETMDHKNMMRKGFPGHA